MASVSPWKYALSTSRSLLDTAEVAASLFICHVWKVYNFPKGITTDNDPTLVAAFWLSYIHLLNIDHYMATAKNPEADSMP